MTRHLLFLLTSTFLMAETIHSSISTYYEHKSFKDSVQKKDGMVYGLGIDFHAKEYEFKLAYEYGETNTKQPPLPDDLNTQKAFFRFAYQFDRRFALNVNYIGILKDNLAETDGGIAFGGGGTYNFSKKFSTNFTQYFTDYKKFDVFQSDLKITYKTRVGKIKTDISSITKYISLHDNEMQSQFIKNAQEKYLTSGLKVHSRFGGYHLGLGAYFGKRAFAVMDDGFKIQHHAMEFDRTFAFGFGKNISNFVIRAQYIYQRAEELPMQNKNMTINNFRLIANYRL